MIREEDDTEMHLIQIDCKFWDNQSGWIGYYKECSFKQCYRLVQQFSFYLTLGLTGEHSWRQADHSPHGLQTPSQTRYRVTQFHCTVIRESYFREAYMYFPRLFERGCCCCCLLLLWGLAQLARPKQSSKEFLTPLGIISWSDKKTGSQCMPVWTLWLSYAT